MYEIDTNSFITEKNRILEYVDNINMWRNEIQSVNDELKALNLEGICESLSIIENTMDIETSNVRSLVETILRIERIYSDAEDEVIDHIRTIEYANDVEHYGIGYFESSTEDARVDSYVMNELMKMIQ